MVGRPLVVLTLLLFAAPASAGSHDPAEVERIAFDLETYRAGYPVHPLLTVSSPHGIVDATMVLVGPGGPFEPDCAGRMQGPPPQEAQFDCSFTLGKDAAPGIYRVANVTVYEGSGRRSVLVAGEDFAASDPITTEFEVEGPPPDNEPPVLLSVHLPDRVEAGDPLDIVVEAEDASGLGFVRILLVPPGDGERIGIECSGDGNLTVTCPWTAPPGAAFGEHYLHQLELVDTAGWKRTYRWGADFDEDEDHDVRFVLAPDFKDTRAPVLKAYRMPREPVARNGTFTIEIDAADQVTVARVLVLVESQVGGEALLVQECEGLGTANVTAVCSGRVPAAHPLGLTKLVWISLRDQDGNEDRFVVGDPPYDPERYSELLAGVSFQVAPPVLRMTGGPGDGALAGLAPAVPDVAPGRVLPVYVAHGPHPAKSVTFRFEGPGGATLGAKDCLAASYPVAGGFRCKLIVPPGTPLGTYRLVAADASIAGSRVELPLDATRAPAFDVVAEPSLLLEVAPTLWQEQVVEGITQAAFNDEPDPMPEPRPSTVAGRPSPRPSASYEKPARDTPAPPIAALAVLLLGAALRIRKP